jgi:hypothetical protein
MKEIVDNRVNVPQYLELGMLPIQNIGVHPQYLGPEYPLFLRENRPGGKRDASKEKGCQKEKALTASHTRVKALPGLSIETPLERFFI